MQLPAMREECVSWLKQQVRAAERALTRRGLWRQGALLVATNGLYCTRWRQRLPRRVTSFAQHTRAVGTTDAVRLVLLVAAQSPAADLARWFADAVSGWHAQTSTDQRGTCTAASIDSRRTRQWRSAPSTRVHMLPFMQANHGGPGAAAEGLAAAGAVRVASAAMPAVTPRGFSSSILHWSEQPQLHPCLRWLLDSRKVGQSSELSGRISKRDVSLHMRMLQHAYHTHRA